jgi:hypothetical protein
VRSLLFGGCKRAALLFAQQSRGAPADEALPFNLQQRTRAIPWHHGANVVQRLCAPAGDRARTQWGHTATHKPRSLVSRHPISSASARAWRDWSRSPARLCRCSAPQPGLSHRNVIVPCLCLIPIRPRPVFGRYAKSVWRRTSKAANNVNQNGPGGADTGGNSHRRCSAAILSSRRCRTLN